MWSSCCGATETNPTSMVSCEDVGLIPGLTSWVRDLLVAVSCGVGHRRGSDAALLWLWSGLAAVALIRPLARELPYAAGAALKRKRQKKKIIFLGLNLIFQSWCMRKFISQIILLWGEYSFK